MPISKRYARVAVPVPLYRLFDYAVDDECEVGSRVLVPFGKRQLVGIVVQVCIEKELEIPAEKLKKLSVILDLKLFSKKQLQLANWIASYYQSPIGMVYELFLPIHLRQTKKLMPKGENFWQINQEIEEFVQLERAPKQKKLFEFLKNCQGANAAKIGQHIDNWRAIMKALIEKGLVSQSEKLTFSEYAPIGGRKDNLTLNDEQQRIVDKVCINEYQAHLIHGITGSGKTEVYLSIVERALKKSGQQALLLVPEISLTPQFVQRVRKRLNKSVAVVHSGLNDTQRHKAWWAASEGAVDIILGTRTSVFTPFKNLAIIIVDEEHDASFKQQDGVRYHARDVATVRAKQNNIPIVMGSATPSFESLHNAELGKFQLSNLSSRATGMRMPKMQLIDMSDPAHKSSDGLSTSLVKKIEKRLDAQQQSILFINRRGFSPTLYCTECSWVAQCPRCDARLTAHLNPHNGMIESVRCHHCGYQRNQNKNIHVCGGCDQHTVMPMGAGTQRAEQSIKQRFPTARLIRLDRDVVTTKNKLEESLDLINSNQVDIILGTQMLTKGHDFPNVTLVGILDADQSLFAVDFRSAEKLYQQLLQVSGRAGRHQAGEVYIQTQFPEHAFFQHLIQQDYAQFASQEIQSRKMLSYPPAGYLTVLRAESVYARRGLDFLTWCRDQLVLEQVPSSIFISDAVAAPMEKRAGRFRAQMLIQSVSRHDLQHLQHRLVRIIANSKKQQQVRWSIDVDPIDLY